MNKINIEKFFMLQNVRSDEVWQMSCRNISKRISNEGARSGLSSSLFFLHRLWNSPIERRSFRNAGRVNLLQVITFDYLFILVLLWKLFSFYVYDFKLLKIFMGASLRIYVLVLTYYFLKMSFKQTHMELIRVIYFIFPFVREF